MHSHRVGFVVAVFIMFFIGQFLHAWLKAQATKNSELNGIKSYSQYIDVYGAILVSRFFLAVLGLMAWASYGNAICGYLAEKYPDWLSWAAKNPIPFTPMTSGIYGYFGDSILDLGINVLSKWIPSLKREVPVIPSGVTKDASDVGKTV